MKNKKLFSLLLAGIMTVSLGMPTYAAADEIADMQAQKSEAEAGLAQTQANISGLESKRQELENYLADLNAQYEELTNSVAQLGIEAGQKEEELKQVKEELKKARKAADKQYESMKIRIAYMYENGGSSALELLLSSKSITEFLNRAENVSQISEYDRNMLKKYEELRQSIADKEAAVEQESESINVLMNERSVKQQEVQAMAASTSGDIESYVSEISASQEEASTLMAEINSADSSIAALAAQAEAEKAAEEARAEKEAQAAAAEEDSEEASEEGASYSQESQSEDDYGYDASEDTTDSSSTSVSSDIVVEEDDEEDESYSQGGSDEGSADGSEGESSSDSSQGTYLGNFTLTAYCNCAQCCGTAGNLTASGTVPTAGRTVAMAGVPFGTQLSINGSIYTVEDLGTPYGHVDIYFDSHSDALSFGLQYADVYQVG